MTTETTINHSEQIERMLDAYDRAITNAVESKFSLPEHAEFDHVRQLMRQAIEQTWDAAHACQQQHAPAVTAKAVTDDPRAEYIAGLRELADLFEQHPDLELPHSGTGSPMLVIPSRGGQRNVLAAWARALPGRKEKAPRDAYFDLIGSLRGLQLKVICHRDEVCQRVVLGTETITEKVPDPDHMISVPMVERETVREIVEWVCAPSILADAEPVGAVS